MISWSLRRLSRRHPIAAMTLTGGILIGGTGLLIVFGLRDLSEGNILRPAVMVVILILISIRLIVTLPKGRL